MKSEEEILVVQERLDDAIMEGRKTRYPNMTYEDGVADCIAYLFSDDPISRIEDDPLPWPFME